jgi:signal transduction histidine kinase
VVEKDTGYGVPQVQIDRIIECLYKIDKSCSGDQGRGTGLGLLIEREIVLAHGRIILVESQSGQ